jgi:uncharacterized membrane protein HdeD (DUF308 family)
MTVVLAKHWWAFALRGLAGIVMGVITFLWPGITLGALVLLFGAYALIDGILSFVGAWRAAHANERWGALLLEGIAGMITAVATIAWPAITAIALAFVIAAWAIVTGAFELVAAIRLRKYITGEWLLGLTGIASIFFGIMIVIAPLTGALVIAMWIGAYAFVFGILFVALGLKLRRWDVSHGPSVPLPV